MGKIIKYLSFIFILSLATIVNAATVTIDDVINKFHSSSLVTSSEIEIEATYTDTHFFISEHITGPDIHTTFTRTNNVLSITIDTSDENSSNKLDKTKYLIDIIGQLHGYKEGDLLNSINNQDITKFTIAKEGLEITKLSETKQTIKFDISKKIPLADYSNTYFELADLEPAKETIIGKSTYSNTKGNLYLAKKYANNKYEIAIGERYDLTSSTYNTLISMLTIIFENNENVISYFKKYYPNIGQENKTFSGITIEVNSTKTAEEQKQMPDEYNYKVIRITIDKETMASAAKSWAYTGENKEDKGSTPGVDYEITDYDPNNSTKEIEKKRKTIIYSIIAIIAIAIIGVTLFIIIKIKKKKEENQSEQY